MFMGKELYGQTHGREGAGALGGAVAVRIKQVNIQCKLSIDVNGHAGTAEIPHVAISVGILK